ncbi:MAG: hypothetical protein ACR2O1_11035, partial [Boseongicola sp.]
MTMILNRITKSKNMHLPEILPAHPCAPETARHTSRPLQYGLIGKLIMAFGVRRSAPTAEELC